MKNKKEQKYFLAIMNRPGDYVFIDISKLDIAISLSFNSLKEIDIFTKMYTIDEIKQSIERANITSTEGKKLVIQDNLKHNPLDVIDKDLFNNFNLVDYLLNLNDKNQINTIKQKFYNLCSGCSHLFNEFLDNKNNNMLISILFTMPYLLFREFLIYIINIKNSEKKIENKLERKYHNLDN